MELFRAFIHLAELFTSQERLDEAEKVHENALGGYEKALEPHCASTQGEGQI